MQTRLGLRFVPFPGLSSSGDQELGEHSYPTLGGASYCLPRPIHSVFWVYNGCVFSGVPCVSSGELISGCDPPGDVNCPESQELNGACLQFARGYLSGAAIAPFWLWLCLPTPPPTPPTACLSSVGNWGGPQPTGSPQSFVL